MTLTTRLCRAACAALPFLATLLPAAPAHADDWLVLSGFSYHFQQDRRDWRQNNPGIGFERDLDAAPGWMPDSISQSVTDWRDVSFSVGYFTNSYDRPTAYLGGRWTPLHLGPVRLGAYGLLATGYPSPVLVLPAATIDMGPVGVNLVAIPNLPGYSGYVGAQFRFSTTRLF